MLVSRQSVQKVTKVAKVKGQSTGRTYTSKYRGVHQTFPTKRWEAQFRCGFGVASKAAHYLVIIKLCFRAA